jgi:serine/threonine protein kinase
MSFDSPYVADTEFVLLQQPSTRQYSTTPFPHPRSTPQQDSKFYNNGSVAHCPPAGADSSPHPIAVPSADLPLTEPKLRLTDLLGKGAAGYVYLGTAEDGSQYAVKVAPWREGKEMLSNEAFIYNHLIQLQGECVPKMFGLFSCKYFDVVVMEFVGRTVDKMEDLSVAQRCVFHNAVPLPRHWSKFLTLIRSHRRALFEDLCRIHEKGVRHGDLRPPNVAIPVGSKPRFIDFSHSRLHDCEGPVSCYELIEACDFLLLGESK